MSDANPALDERNSVAPHELMRFEFELMRWRYRRGRRDIAQRSHEPMMVEPSDPFQRRQFDRLTRFPRRTTMNDEYPP